MAVSDADHHVTIAREITKNIARDRAVIVFFADSQKLSEFEKSSHFRKFTKRECLRETQTHIEKEAVIKKATTAGQVTLSTAVFGRGTDFFCNDRKVIMKGGVHVIQTFLSLDNCEEAQIQGRTSRQGQEGSFGAILNCEDPGMSDSTSSTHAMSTCHHFGAGCHDKHSMNLDVWPLRAFLASVPALKNFPYRSCHRLSSFIHGQLLAKTQHRMIDAWSLRAFLASVYTSFKNLPYSPPSIVLFHGHSQLLPPFPRLCLKCEVCKQWHLLQSLSSSVPLAELQF